MRNLWARGPWDDEPDEQRMMYYGFGCEAARHPRLGCWVGYVIVPPGHPWHGRIRGDEAFDGVKVHGGITYAGYDLRDETMKWWVGFDCAHAGDATPFDLGIGPGAAALAVQCGMQYRDLPFVTAQLEQLAHAAHRARFCVLAGGA